MKMGINFSTTIKITSVIILIETIVAPVGKSYIYEIMIEIIKHTTDKIAEVMVTLLKLLQTLIDVIAGNTTKAEIISEPIILIPRTMVIAVRIAISILNKPTFVPVEVANDSSKVTAKILL